MVEKPVIHTTKKNPRDPKGWYSRGYLPHFDGGDVIQFVTFRLYDSLPNERIKDWRDELAHFSKEISSDELAKRIEEWLDRGEGDCWLKVTAIAALVQNALLYFDGERYLLHAWVIMPNHVHALFSQTVGYRLPEVVQSWKSYTALEANRLLNRAGTFWQADYFDRYIRDEKHFEATKYYIEENPVKANLCPRKEDWAYSSASYTKSI